jgi:hypothetical protein
MPVSPYEPPKEEGEPQQRATEVFWTLLVATVVFMAMMAYFWPLLFGL